MLLFSPFACIFDIFWSVENRLIIGRKIVPANPMDLSPRILSSLREVSEFKGGKHASNFQEQTTGSKNMVGMKDDFYDGIVLSGKRYTFLGT